MLLWIIISTCSIRKQYYILRFHYNPWVQLAIVTREIFRFIQEFVVFLSKAWAGYLWWVSASYIKYIALMYIDISERFYQYRRIIYIVGSKQSYLWCSPKVECLYAADFPSCRYGLDPASYLQECSGCAGTSHL